MPEAGDWRGGRPRRLETGVRRLEGRKDQGSRILETGDWENLKGVNGER